MKEPVEVLNRTAYYPINSLVYTMREYIVCLILHGAKGDRGMAYLPLRLVRYLGVFVLIFVVLGLPLGGWDKGLLPNVPAMPAANLEAPASFTVMSFNMHHGEGMDGKVDILRIAELLQHENADIIALQEVDRYRLRSGFVDQARELSEMLGMHMVYSPSLTYKVGQYGMAVLSRYPIVDSSWTLLPGNLETRSLLMTTVQIGSEPVHVATTHLGLSGEDRKLQLTRVSELCQIRKVRSSLSAILIWKRMHSQSK